MQAFEVTAPQPDLERAGSMREVEEPDPGPGHVRVRITASAICRTDLQLTSGELPAHKLPIIPGHQVVGVVDKLGPDASDDLLGQRVGLVWLASACGHCRFCLSGRENLCNEAQFTGYDVDGGYAQYAIARADFVHPIPDMGPQFEGQQGDDAVAPLLCGGVIGFRALRIAGLSGDTPGMRVGHFGFGASASLAMQVASYWGADNYVMTRSESEIERARELGAVWAGTYDEVPPVKLDAAVTYAPVGWIVPKALSTLDKGGRVVINAIHLPEIPPLNYDDLWWERSIMSVANVTREDVRDFLNVVGPAGVVTAHEEIPLEQARTGLERVRSGDVQGAFVLHP